MKHRQHGMTMVETMLILGIIAGLMAIIGPPLISAMRGPTSQAVDQELRRAALVKMYEDAGMTPGSVWPTLVVRALERRGPGYTWDRPEMPTPATLDDFLASRPPLTPALVVPDWTDPQAVQDLGFSEPDPRKVLGLQ